MVNLMINGKEVTVPKSTSVLDACKSVGIDIPTLCHDKRLIPHGGCRICVVEIKGARSLAASCATPVNEGMDIQTHSQKVLDARKTNLELLWANHNNDCLTCGKAGDCKLQDYCYEYDIEAENKVFKSEFTNFIDSSNPFYKYNRDKCIKCGLCVNVCKELQGTGAIEFNERGYHTKVGHAFDGGMDHSNCVSCGNCVTVCPTGALMEKTRKKFRTWDVEKKVRTTCSYCGVGCQIELVVKGNKVVRVDPVQGQVNDGLLCVKGKFAYHFIDHKDRLTSPLIRKNGVLEKASWEEALTLVTSKIKDAKDNYGPDSIAGFSSARCTNEDNYVFQKLFRAVIGTNNVDHCARL